LQISIDPARLNKDDLLRLAEILNKDFCHEERLVALIFSDYSSAKRYVYSDASPYFPETQFALRADYSLDRLTGDEFIEFYPDPNKREYYETFVVRGSSKETPGTDKPKPHGERSPP
jgi:hypothetical protein